MTRLWTIAANSFTATTRRPIFTVLLLVAFGAMVANVPLSMYAMDTSLNRGNNRMLVNAGLTTLMFAGLFVAAFSASGVLARQIEQRTVLALVAKPVARPVILLGKSLGVAAAVTVAMYLASLVFLMTVRHGVMSRATDQLDWVVLGLGGGAFVLAALIGMFCNYFFGWSYTGVNVAASTVTMTVAMVVILWVDRDWHITAFGAGINPQVFVAVVLAWMGVMVLTALAMAVSTRAGEMATLGVCVGIFFLSQLTDSLFQAHAQGNLTARLAYWATPNLSYFLAVDALSLDQTIGAGYVALAVGYGACFVVAALLVAVVLFQTREIDARATSATAPPLVNVYAWALRLGAVAAVLIGLAILGRLGRSPSAWIGGAVGLAGAVSWLLAGAFGRGARWALGLIVLAAAALFIHRAAIVATEGPAGADWLFGLTATMLTAAHTLYVLIMCLRPATKAFFSRRYATAEAAGV